MEINLKNKTAWVFGGSRGIGRSIAITLSRAGASVVLVSRSSIALQKVKEELCVSMGQEHDIIAVDMTNTEKLVSKFKNYRNLGALDIIVNNSGGPRSGSAHTADLDEYSSAFSQHVLAAQVITKIGLPIMKKKQFGRIINIISTSVKQPIRGLGVSNTIRGAMANWSKTLASELGPFGVTVNNILPGATETGRLISLIKNQSLALGVSEESVVEKMKKTIPVGRFAKPEEVAYVVAFLCSTYAAYINGTNIPVDGGRTGCL
tara:strand:+ start:172 stop:957 length:786 start_codon:yes stop_codon:yes gene_type:complete